MKHTNPIYLGPDGHQRSIPASNGFQELQALVINLPPEEQFGVMIHIQFELFDQLWGENRRCTGRKKKQAVRKDKRTQNLKALTAPHATEAQI